MDMIKVLIADDHILIRKGIRLLLETFDDIEVAAEAGDGEEAIRMTGKHQPHVILMDLSMPGGIDGFTAIKEIMKRYPDVKVIILTMHDEEAYIRKAVELQAHGYILKKSRGNELFEAIQSVHKGKRFYRTGIPEDQINKMFKNRGTRRSILTNREQEIVRLTMLGYSN